MDVSADEAREALGDIERTQAATRKVLSDGPTGRILILWGCLWAVGYLGTHFLRGKSGWLWLGLDMVGVAGTFAVMWPGRSRTRNPYSWRIGVFWLALFAYGFLWVVLLSPLRGNQVGAFFPTLVMFAYVVLGLFFWRYLLWVGLITTALTMAGYFLLPTYFCIWMAFVGGGSLIVPGLHLRLRRS